MESRRGSWTSRSLNDPRMDRPPFSPRAPRFWRWWCTGCIPTVPSGRRRFDSDLRAFAARGRVLTDFQKTLTMALPKDLITNRTAKLPGDWRKQPAPSAKPKGGGKKRGLAKAAHLARFLATPP